MAETLTPTNDRSETPDLQTIRIRLKQISSHSSDHSSGSALADHHHSIQECASDFEGVIRAMELEESNVAALAPEDFDAYEEQLKKEISSAEEENMKISAEIDDLKTTLAGESNLLESDLESLAFSLDLIDSQDLNVRSSYGDAHGGPMNLCEDDKFEILKLQQKIEKCKNYLNTFQELEFIFRRIEAVGQIEDKLSKVKVLEFEGNCIRLSMKTDIASSDGLLRFKLDCLVEPSILEHELLIEVADKTLELQKVEIFPNDVPLDDIIRSVKISSQSQIPSCGSLLQSLVRQVQYRILLCTLKRLLVTDAKRSRHSFEYSDGDEIITAHLVAGIDVFIKIPQSWPISNSGLLLVSLKNTNIHSKSISLSFLCKIKELANSLNIQTRGHLVRFMDAVEEILVREMHSELRSSDIAS